MYSGDCIEPTDGNEADGNEADGNEADGEEVELVEADDVLPDASPPLPRRRLRLQVGEWYVTLAMVGALVGLFAAGILVALNQAFPDGTSGRLNGGWLTGLAIGIIVGTVRAGCADGWRGATGRLGVAEGHCRRTSSLRTSRQRKMSQKSPLPRRERVRVRGRLRLADVAFAHGLPISLGNPELVGYYGVASGGGSTWTWSL